ncbi:MAG: hypothetical protein K5886_08460 [Lachnospiraceae bacterium]|nr:hypothetical protein [Lachnospiraceae bacterium]
MKNRELGKLNKRTKTIGITVIILIYICICAVCINLQNRSYEIRFDKTGIELNTAEILDGRILSKEISDYTFKTKPFILPTGDYLISITYSSTADGAALVQGNNDCVFDIHLPSTGGAEQTLTDARMILPIGTDKGCIKFSQEGEGEISVKDILITSQGYIFSDYYATMVFAGIIAALLIFLTLIFNRLRISTIGLSYVGLLFIALIIVNIPYFTKGTYYQIDTQAHLKRIEAIAQGIRDRQFPVIIGPNYANQYGELVVLQPGLFLYIPAVLRLFNVSVPTAYNFYMILVNFATAFTVVLCAERFFASLRWSIVAAVLYLIEPFRMYIMMKLGAGAGMGTALIFLPFLLVGMHDVMNRSCHRWMYISIGLWGMACSHVMGFALSSLAMVIYFLFHLKMFAKPKVLVSLVKAAALFLVLTAGVLAPFVGYYFTDWNRSALAWSDFYHFGVQWDREALNVITLLVMIISFYGIVKRKLLTKFGRGIFMMGLISMLMALPVFPWFLLKNVPYVETFLSMMQYPMRFHFLAAPCMAYVASEAICSHMDSRTKLRRKITWSVMTLLGIGILINYYDYYSSKKLFYEPSVGEINTVMEDYLPEGTQTEWYATDTGEFSDYDNITAYSYSKVNSHIDCTYSAVGDGRYMDFPLFYYDGYVAYDQNGQPLKVEKGTKNRVRVYLTGSGEIEELHLRFKVNPLYTYLCVISMIAGLIWFAFYFVYLGRIAVNSGRIISHPVNRTGTGGDDAGTRI